MITDWVDAHLPVAFLDDPVSIRPRDTATMVVDGRTVRETLVAVPRAPEPGWVHAVVSEPVEGTGAARPRPAALLLNISVTLRTGPTRGWVSTGRQVAANGSREHPVEVGLAELGDARAHLGGVHDVDADAETTHRTPLPSTDPPSTDSRWRARAPLLLLAHRGPAVRPVLRVLRHGDTPYVRPELVTTLDPVTDRLCSSART